MPRDGQPLAAHVAAVSEDGATVNLQVIDANGHAHARQDVPFYEGGHSGGESYADWMPYQRAQHALEEGAAVARPPSEVEDARFVNSVAGPDTDYRTATTAADLSVSRFDLGRSTPVGEGLAAALEAFSGTDAQASAADPEEA